jgi:hypothetical protein
MKLLLAFCVLVTFRGHYKKERIFGASQVLYKINNLSLSSLSVHQATASGFVKSMHPFKEKKVKKWCKYHIL